MLEALHTMGKPVRDTDKRHRELIMLESSTNF
jgi:hypothetical protein